MRAELRAAQQDFKPDEQGDTTRRVLVTEAPKGGEELSYTVKVMLNWVPIPAAAVFKAHGVRPTL